MRSLPWLIFLLLRLEQATGWLDNCPCSSIPSTPSACPFDRECDPSKVKDANCTLECADGYQLMYRTGIPWRSTASLRCNDGRHQPSTGSTLGASVAAIACVGQSKCTNCVPPSADAFCHPDYVCRTDAMMVKQSDDGCSAVSCSWGELMVIDTVPPSTVSRPSVPHIDPVSKATAPQGAPTLNQAQPLESGPVHGSDTIATNGSNQNQGAIMPFGPSSTTAGPVPGVGMNQIKPGTMDVIPKKEEEYYDDPELPPERSTMAVHQTSTASTTSAATTASTTMTPSTTSRPTTLTSTEATADTPQVDLFGRPISRMNSLNGLKKTTKDDDYDDEDFSSSSSFLARMRRGVFSFINRQTRRLERHIFGFSEESTSHSITVDRKSGTDKLVNRVIGGASPSSPFARWDEFEDQDKQIRSFTTTTKRPDAGRIMGKIPTPQTARRPSNWLADIFETTTRAVPKGQKETKENQKEKFNDDAQFAGGIGVDWNDSEQMLVRDNVRQPAMITQSTTTVSPMAPAASSSRAASMSVAPKEAAAASPRAPETTTPVAGTTRTTRAASSTTATIATSTDSPNVADKGRMLREPAAATAAKTPVAAAAMSPTVTTATTASKAVPSTSITSERPLAGSAAGKPQLTSSASAPNDVASIPHWQTLAVSPEKTAFIAEKNESNASESVAPLPTATTLASDRPVSAAAAAATTPMLLVEKSQPNDSESVALLPTTTTLASGSSVAASAASATSPTSSMILAEKKQLNDAASAAPNGLGAAAATPIPAAKNAAAGGAPTALDPTTAGTSLRRVVEEGPRIFHPEESHIDEIGLLTVPARGKEMEKEKEVAKEDQIGQIVMNKESANQALEQMAKGPSLPVIDGEAVLPGGKKKVEATVPHTVDFDSTSPRQPWGKPANSTNSGDRVVPAVIGPAAPAVAAAAAVAAQPAAQSSAAATSNATVPAATTLVTPHPQPSLAFSRAGTLRCSGNGLWYDANFALRQSGKVTCARKKSCGTCSTPPLLQQCDERHECGSPKIVSVEAENGCVKGVCEDGESFIAVHDLTTGKSVADLTEMTCDPFGRWRASMFDVIGERIEAVCYRPKCKKCSLRELACPTERHCDMSRLAEPERNQRCYSLRCGEGARMLIRDDAGAIRKATKIDCSHNASWVFTEEGTGEEIPVTGAEAAITCEYMPPPCQMCPRLPSSSECPGAEHRPCFPLTQKGGVAEKSCRINTCEPGDELWVKLPTGWTHPDKLSMLGCAGDQGWIGNDGVTKLPLNAEAVCKRAPCDNCIVPTISAFCPDEHGEKGCDSFAMRRSGTRYDEKTGCTSIICPNEGKIAFHNPATGSFVTTTKQMHCVNGQWLTDLGEPVPPTLHVTCTDWRGNRSVCGNGGCTYSLEHPRAKMRYSEAGGCYELYCETGNILGFNPKYSSWEPANQGHFTCSDKGWKRAYGVRIADLTDYKFHIRVKCQ